MRASSIQPEAVTWLWHPFVPLGKITALAGQMGQAKSLATVWMAAAVSNGQGIGHTHPSGVVMLNAEDDAADTIRPRLEAAGADLDRVWIDPDITLNTDRLNAVCDELGDVRLITIDPIQAFLPSGVNSWKGQDVRQALEPLRQLAAERSLAVVLVQHLNRRQDAGDPLARIADSQGIPQLARSVLIWGPDPSDPDGDNGTGKALTRAKGNLARTKASATFTIAEKTVTDAIKAPTLERGADREVTSDEVISDAETRTAMDEATEWLQDILADGPVDAKEVHKQARDAGISERTLRRAKRPAGVVSESNRAETGIGGWMWRLKDPSINPLGHVGHVGHLGIKVAKEAKVANVNGNAIPADITTAHPRVHDADPAATNTASADYVRRYRERAAREGWIPAGNTKETR